MNIIQKSQNPHPSCPEDKHNDRSSSPLMAIISLSPPSLSQKQTASLPIRCHAGYSSKPQKLPVSSKPKPITRHPLPKSQKGKEGEEGQEKNKRTSGCARFQEPEADSDANSTQLNFSLPGTEAPPKLSGRHHRYSSALDLGPLVDWIVKS